MTVEVQNNCGEMATVRLRRKNGSAGDAFNVPACQSYRLMVFKDVDLGATEIVLPEDAENKRCVGGKVERSDANEKAKPERRSSEGSVRSSGGTTMDGRLKAARERAHSADEQNSRAAETLRKEERRAEEVVRRENVEKDRIAAIQAEKARERTRELQAERDKRELDAAKELFCFDYASNCRLFCQIVIIRVGRDAIKGSEKTLSECVSFCVHPSPVRHCTRINSQYRQEIIHSLRNTTVGKYLPAE
jgi:hypothetical protein